MPFEYDSIKRELIQDLHLDVFTPEHQEELLSIMGEVLLKRIFLETMEKIGGTGVAEYEKLLDALAGQDQIDNFFEQKIPGYPVFVRSIVDAFKEEMSQDKMM
ncbi:MAG: DUF5663 domain-containing protein [Minisyncoccota bacterium]